MLKEIEERNQEWGEAMQVGHDYAMDNVINEIQQTINHWQKRFEPDPHLKKQGLADDSLVYFEFTKMVLESLVYRFQEMARIAGTKENI
jgi:hypothetical protein